jgi:hypothetical protein
MMPISSRFREPSLLSPRTAEYVEAMIREGDSFDYSKWLNTVREEEAQAKRVPTATSCDVVAPRADKPALNCKPALNLRALRRPHRQAKSQSPQARLRRWLEKVRRARDDFQASRARDAVYAYLEAVLTIVEHYRVRRRTNRLLRHAFKFANLSVDKNADPFSAVIRCTSGSDVDNKTISKWSRALRYVARFKKLDSGLPTFMKEAGGVNACADRYARLMRYRLNGVQLGNPGSQRH